MNKSILLRMRLEELSYPFTDEPEARRKIWIEKIQENLSSVSMAEIKKVYVTGFVSLPNINKPLDQRIILYNGAIYGDLEGEDKNCILVLPFASSIYSMVGNEFWSETLPKVSDQAVLASCSWIATLQNPLINPFMISDENIQSDQNITILPMP